VSTRVKICGITRLEDAQLCVEAGVDALGFNFWPGSKRYIQVERAREIAAALPSGVLRVGVFVQASPEAVRETVKRVGLAAVQLHGDEDPALYSGVGVALWQVLRVADRMPGAPSPAASAVLLDAKVAGFGGAGMRFDWKLARAAADWALPVWIAGGLDPHNVGEALQLSGASGVDVASGVESAPGLKDPARVRAFIAAARAAEQRT
jgi:phosphoribosylanthranilate isomerase